MTFKEYLNEKKDAEKSVLNQFASVLKKLPYVKNTKIEKHEMNWGPDKTYLKIVFTPDFAKSDEAYKKLSTAPDPRWNKPFPKQPWSDILDKFGYKYDVQGKDGVLLKGKIPEVYLSLTKSSLKKLGVKELPAV